MAAMPACQAAAFSSSASVRLAAPAEFTSTSIGPSSASARATIAAAAAASVRSAANVCTSPKALRAASRFACERETMATRAPSARNARAQASPMPLLPPVMRMFFPFRPSSMTISLRYRREDTVQLLIDVPG